MPYSKTNWKDRIIERPLTFTLTENDDGTVTLNPVTGLVTEEGTPVNANLLNKIEQGIADVDQGLTTHDGEAASELDSSHVRLATQNEVHVGDVNGPVVVTPATLDGMWITEATPTETQRGYLGQEMYLNSDTWVKMKQFTIPHDGTYRVKFSMRIHGSDHIAYGQIYKNGVAHGTQRTEGNAIATTYTEDLYFSAGDTCEIWCRETDITTNGMYLYWASIHYDPTIKQYRLENPKVQDATGEEIYI